MNKILVFLSQKCPCSCSHVSHLNELSQKHKNISFFGVISEPVDQENQNEVVNYFKKENFAFPIIRDDQQVLVNQYGALKTPHSIILKKNQDNYEVIYEGGVSDKSQFTKSTKHFLEENLTQVKLGKELTYKQGVSLGCYIKRM